MAYYSYKVEHDYGLAPNPFGGYCTLAVCKPTIRNNKNLKKGDWIFGTGSVKLKRLHQLIYAMKVEEIITFNEYWNDPRFQYKKPVINGSLVQMYGDNFYYYDENAAKWIQKDSAHSREGGRPHRDHIKIDTGGKNVLVSTTFYYFGDKSIPIKEKYWPICSEGRSVKGPSIPTTLADEYVSKLQNKYNPGIHGDPINWKEYL